jgi:uncharacterized repeat protein (TIGR01451 family)
VTSDPFGAISTTTIIRTLPPVLKSLASYFDDVSFPLAGVDYASTNVIICVDFENAFEAVLRFGVKRSATGHLQQRSPCLTAFAGTGGARMFVVDFETAITFADPVVNGGAAADGSLTAVVDAATPVVGTDVGFTLVVTNNGPDPALNCIVGAAVPASYAYVSDTSGGNYDSSTGQWSVGDLSAAATDTFTLTLRVRGAQYGSYAIPFEILAFLGNDNDSTPNNGIESEDDQQTPSVTPTPRCDLALSMATGEANASLLYPLVSQARSRLSLGI